MIVLLYGADTLAIRRRLQQLKDEADGGSGMLATNYLAVDGREAKPQDILAPAMSPPFLAPKRLVVVENLLERFEQPRRNETRASRLPSAFEPLVSGLREGIPDSTILVFVMPQKSERNALLDELRKLPGVSDEHRPAIAPHELPRYITDEAAARGLRFRPGPPRQHHPGSDEWLRGATSDPATLLAALTHGDTLAISNELDKLALYTLDRGAQVTVDDIYEVCAGDREAGEFALRDAILDGHLKDALQTLELLRTQVGFSESAVLFQLFSAYRNLAIVVDMTMEKAPPEEIGKAMGRAGRHAKLRQAAIARARRIGPDGLRAAFEALVEADRTNKLGEVDADVSLEILFGKLCAL